MTPSESKDKPRVLPRLKINAVSIAVLSIFSLFLALVPLLMIQLQKSQLMQVAAQSRVDSVLWITYQFEREHSRMRMALRNVIDNPTSSVQQDLALRYDIFFSRLDLVKTSPSLLYLHHSREYSAVIRSLDAFVAQADPVITSLNAGPISTDAFKALLQQANADDGRGGKPVQERHGAGRARAGEHRGVRRSRAGGDRPHRHPREQRRLQRP